MTVKKKSVILVFTLFFLVSQASAVEGFDLDAEIPETSYKDNVQQGSSGFASVIDSVKRYFFGEPEPERPDNGLDGFTVSDYTGYKVKDPSVHYVSKSSDSVNKFIVSHENNKTGVLEGSLGSGCGNLVFDNGALPSKWSNDSVRYEFYDGHQQVLVGFKVQDWENKTSTSQSCTVSFTDGSNDFKHDFKVKVSGTKYPDMVENFFTSILGLKGVELYNPEYICPAGLEGVETYEETGQCPEELSMIPIPTIQGLSVLALILFIAWVFKRFSGVEGGKL